MPGGYILGYRYTMILLQNSNLQLLPNILGVQTRMLRAIYIGDDSYQEDAGHPRLDNILS